jgi:uncharacterized peroxidase-related enzyme
MSQADEKSKALLEGVKRSLGMVPNLLQTLAHSPAALNAYISINQALSQALSAPLREQIALAVAGANQCDYCASAHAALGAKAGVNEDELIANLRGTSNDEQTRAALRFALAVVKERGWVSDEELSNVRDAGFSDGEIAEIIAVTSVNIFTNYFNHVALTTVDFPHIDTSRFDQSADEKAA